VRREITRSQRSSCSGVEEGGGGGGWRWVLYRGFKGCLALPIEVDAVVTDGDRNRDGDVDDDDSNADVDVERLSVDILQPWLG